MMLATNTRWLCSSTSSSRLSKQAFQRRNSRSFAAAAETERSAPGLSKSDPGSSSGAEHQDDSRHPLAVIVHSAGNVRDRADPVADRRVLCMGYRRAMADGRRTQNLAMSSAAAMGVTASALHRSEQLNRLTSRRGFQRPEVTGSSRSGRRWNESRAAPGLGRPCESNQGERPQWGGRFARWNDRLDAGLVSANRTAVRRPFGCSRRGLNR